eukprot:6475257-Amphidinium_carterae.1
MARCLVPPPRHGVQALTLGLTKTNANHRGRFPLRHHDRRSSNKLRHALSNGYEQAQQATTSLDKLAPHVCKLAKPPSPPRAPTSHPKKLIKRILHLDRSVPIGSLYLSHESHLVEDESQTLSRDDAEQKSSSALIAQPCIQTSKSPRSCDRPIIGYSLH